MPKYENALVVTVKTMEEVASEAEAGQRRFDTPDGYLEENPDLFNNLLTLAQSSDAQLAGAISIPNLVMSVEQTIYDVMQREHEKVVANLKEQS